MKKFLVCDMGEQINPRYVVETIQDIPEDLPFHPNTLFIATNIFLISSHLEQIPPLVFTSFTYNAHRKFTTNRLNFVDISGIDAHNINCLVMIEFIPIVQRQFQIGDRVRNIRDRNIEFTVDVIQVQADGNRILWDNTLLYRFYAKDIELVPTYVPKITCPEKFTIGSDIEVAFVKNKKMVNSNEDRVFQHSYNEDSHFGTDHSGGVGEFRPQFGSHPMEHWNNLKGSIRKVVEGGYFEESVSLNSSHILGNYVVGGHIHFGIKDATLIKKCQLNLDYWLLPTIQPLFPKEVFMNRIRVGYGRLSTAHIRNQNHGFEYRLVPSFIFDEKVAAGILCLAYAIVKLTIEGKLKVRLEEVDANWMQKFFEDYNNYGLNNLHDVRQESIKKLIDKNLLRGLHQYIVPLFQAIQQEKQFSGDVAEGWGMKYNYVFNRRSEKTPLTATVNDGGWVITHHI
jgi:hypothetical protein